VQPACGPLDQEEAIVSWAGKLQEATGQVEKTTDTDAWSLRLARVRGKIDYDGFERVSSQNLLDLLEVPQRQRRAGLFRRLARVMTELGWRATRVRDLNGRGFKEQLRGFCRGARDADRARLCGEGHGRSGIAV
jgi:hypothetical protein